MKAIVYKKPKHVQVETIPDARIEAGHEAIVKITTAGICGSDLHMYEGRTAASGGVVMGHENMGVVEQVGPAVFSIQVGDRVVLPFNIACGFCSNCSMGWTQSCLMANPEDPHAAYGYVGMGPYPGGQANLLKVPYADFNCLKLPGAPGDELEDDFLLLSDVFPTGYHATELACVKPGSTVAIFGAGPVGLLAAHSAFIRGASEVYVVDRVLERLEKAREIGAIAVDFTLGDVAGQIEALRKRNPMTLEKARPGEERMKGVMCGIDAVGYQAKDASHPNRENPAQILGDLAEIVNPNGHIGIVGVYLTKDPGAPNRHAREGIIEMPLGKLFDKGITLGMGQTPVKKYNAYLRDLIISGRAKPSFIISHRLTLDEAPGAYDKFDRRIDGYTKVVLKPNAAA